MIAGRESITYSKQNFRQDENSFEIEEECFLKEVSKAFNISDQEFLLVDNWVRRMYALEEEARGFLAS